MNQRQWKKACKKAAAEIERRWPGEYQFSPSDGEDTVSPPRNYRPTGRHRNSRIELRYPSAPAGTPLYAYRCSYEYDEWDVWTPLALLDMLNANEAYGDQFSEDSGA